MRSTAVARAPKWAAGTTKARAKTLIADVEKREREALRGRLHVVSVARKRAIARIRAWARGKIAHIRERAKRARARCLARIKASESRHRDLVTQRRDLMLKNAKRRFGAVHARRRAELDEAIRLESIIRDRERKALKLRTTAVERRQESDDEVRRNLDADMVPVFDRVASAIRGSAKMTRTEAFLHWVHENSDEVLRIQAELAEQDVARWLEEQHEQERRAVRASEQKGKIGPETPIIAATWRGHRFSVHEGQGTEGEPTFALILQPKGHRSDVLRWGLTVRGDDWSLGLPQSTARGPSKPSAAMTKVARTWVDSLDGYKPLDDLSDVPF